MTPMQKPAIRVTRTDFNRLQMLANALNADNELKDELDRAEIVTDAGDFIGIGSSAVYRTASREERFVTLVLPNEADISRKRISIMTPVGIALLGLSAGQSIEWQTRDGRTETLTVVSVNRQTQAADTPEDDGPSAA